MSSLDRLARANISGVGANLPAKARVIELVSASARLRMKSAKTCQWSSAMFDALEGGLGLVDHDDQAVRAQRAQEFLLAAVAGVQRADADARVLGHRGDRRAGVGDEHRPGRIEDPLVVAGRLGLAAAHRAVALAARGRLGHENECSRDWNKPFRSDIVGTEDFVPVLPTGGSDVISTSGHHRAGHRSQGVRGIPGAVAVAGLRRGHHGGGDGPARLDHRPGRGADDPARTRRLLRRHRVGHRRLRPGHGGRAADRRAARRHLRAAADAADRDRRVRGRVGGVRRGRDGR